MPSRLSASHLSSRDDVSPSTPDSDASSDISSPPATPTTAVSGRRTPGSGRTGKVPASRRRSSSDREDSVILVLENGEEPVAGPSSRPDGFVYPPAVADVTTLPAWTQDFKAARWIACTVEDCDCEGLRPPSGASISIGSRSQMNEAAVWQTCGECGHGWSEADMADAGGHGLPTELQDMERIRRRKVAGRLEEMLQDKGKLLDFGYTDPDIESMQRQMDTFKRPTSHDSSPDISLADRPAKRVRTTATRSGSPSASEASSEDEGPLLQTTQGGRMPAGASGKTSRKGISSKRPNKGSGRGAGAGKTASKGLAREPIQIVKREGENMVVDDLGNVIRPLEDDDAMDEDVQDVANETMDNGEPDETPDETRLKAQQEAQVEADLVDKLAAGVSVDADMDSVAGLPHVHMDEVEYNEDWDEMHFEKLPSRPAEKEFQNDYIRLPVVSSSEPSPQSSVILIGLKNLFQRQLPKMPREYITRLVLDQKHYSMAIVKRGLRVVGGICYRPFESRGFAEIVFCAVESSEQIKGYGSYLMNAVKDHVRKAHPTIQHFLTYADNFAIGYFKKQGFTKEITFPRDRWVGYIKDYDSANLMMCKMLPRVRYLEVHQMLHDQKAAVLAKIQTISHSHIVRPGLEVFKNRKPGEDMKLPKEQIPGLVESGWDPEIDDIIRRPKRNPSHVIMQQVLTDLQNSGTEWAFGKPVDSAVVHDYYSAITHPMDLQTMEYKLDGNQYDDLSDFINDVRLIVSNCKQYNGEKTSNTYTNAANKLERALENSLKKRQKDHQEN